MGTQFTLELVNKGFSAKIDYKMADYSANGANLLKTLLKDNGGYFVGFLGLIKEKLFGKKENVETSVKTYNREFKVAGVTFNNDDNKSRQEILKAIKEKRKPFDNKLDIGIEGYTFEGEAALAVTVNRKMIGNISRKDLPFFESNRERMLGFESLYVGEYNDAYYAKLKVIIKTKNQSNR